LVLNQTVSRNLMHITSSGHNVFIPNQRDGDPSPMNTLQLLISIDDTDNASSPGSGTVAEALTEELQKRDLALCSGITRHQLLVHPAIPYTSHNSAMCFPAICTTGKLDEVILFSQDYLAGTAAIGSDPGLAVAVGNGALDTTSLISFGQRAKQCIVAKREAEDTARLAGVHLSAHGGSGEGIIGALAAIGLRLQGSDGRFRGWHALGATGTFTTPAQLCAHPFVDAVISDTGEQLTMHTPIILAEERVKTVLLNGQRVVPVARRDKQAGSPLWTTLSKSESKRF